MRSILLVLMLGTLLFSNGCYYDNEEELYPNSFCDTTNITYSGTILPIVQAKCATPGCHVPGGDGAGDFTTYSGIVAKIVNDGPFLPSVRYSPGAIGMPTSGPLPSCELQQLELWVAAGYPEN
ncbi:MAG: hypothetical protein ABI432_17170 [Flavobacteriales bacterium]